MSTLMSSRAVVAESRPSFDDFFEAYARQVAAIVALSTGDVSLAEDATQEAMARAHAKWKTVAQLARPDLWVIRVAGNIAIDFWRRRRREVTLSEANARLEPRDEIMVLWLRWGLDRLTPEDRLLLILRHRDGLTVDEMSALLAKSPNTVMTYLKRARRRLRAVLSEEDA
jgi:RNA polymerase sigma factor (sigma-70 family)